MLSRFFYLIILSLLHLINNQKNENLSMKRKISVILFSILFLQSCQNKETSSLENSSIIKVDSIHKEPQNNSVDNKEQVDLVKNFMKWYIKNLDRLYKFNTIEGGASVQENEEPQNYFVNFSEVDKYITELKKSGFLTDNFLKNEKQIFVEGDEYFKKNPENDGPPYGFDYDRFFFTQESLEDVFPNIEESKYSVTQKDDFTSEVRFYLPISGVNYKYTLKKINAKWFIEKIDSEERP